MTKFRYKGDNKIYGFKTAVVISKYIIKQHIGLLEYLVLEDEKRKNYIRIVLNDRFEKII